MKISVIMPCLFVDRWQPKLAAFALETMHDKTNLEFETVIVETKSEALRKFASDHGWTYIHKPEVTQLTSDLNDAILKASGDHLVHVGIDIIVHDFWLEAMVECFNLRPDCGAATVRVAESGAYIGPKVPIDSIDEAMYGPLMMWARNKNGQQWIFDEEFEDHAADSDLVMRMYEAGLRSYRSNKAMAWHLNKVTWSAQKNTAEREKKAHELFKKRHGDSPLWMAKMIMKGGIHYGREFEKSSLIYTDVVVRGTVSR